jgi:hypothetical protein
MEQGRRSSIAIALILILIGAWFLAVQLMPSLWDWAYGRYTWPLSIVGIGALLLVIGLVFWLPGLAIPACIVGGIGGLLYWQNATGNWDSWAYAWALIPGFVGVGITLSGLLERRASTVRGGLWLVLISLVMFVIFGAFLGGPAIIGSYWPVLLIALGLVLLGRALFVRR